MTALFNRWLPGLTLLAWSAVLLAYYITGRISSLLYPSFRINVLIAGIAMLVMAACFILLPGVARCCDDERCGHPLGKRKMGRLLTFMILILPLSAAAMFSPKDFSYSLAINRGVQTDLAGLGRRSGQGWASQPAAAPTPTADDPTKPALPTKDGSPAAAQTTAQSSTQAIDDYLPRAKDGNIEVQVIDLLYAAQDTSMKADFEGKTVETIGQLMPDDSHNATGNRFKLMRMFMWCCAADAKPIATLVESPDKTNIADMAWVRVVGKVTFPVEGGRTTPVLVATKVTQTDPPEETMLY